MVPGRLRSKDMVELRDGRAGLWGGHEVYCVDRVKLTVGCLPPGRHQTRMRLQRIRHTRVPALSSLQLQFPQRRIAGD